MNYSPSHEAPTERLVMILLEGQNSYSSDHRHIRATVVRRAASHVVMPNTNLDSNTTIFYDDREATGYRNASWSSHKSSAIRVDGLQIRGQMDVHKETTKQMREGQPYGNEIEFDLYRIRRNDAKQMHEAFIKIDKAVSKMEANRTLPQYRDDTFTNAVALLAVIFNIEKFLFLNPNHVGSTALSNEAAWVECNRLKLNENVQHLVKKAHSN